MRSGRLILMPMLLACSCSTPEIDDHGSVCVVGGKSVGDEHTLSIVADSSNCAADHKGAEFRCETDLGNGPNREIRVRTYFRDGQDPNPACAGSLQTRCDVAVEAGHYVLWFGDQKRDLEVPVPAQVCMPETFEVDR